MYTVLLPGGIPVNCESADDVIRLYRKLGISPNAPYQFMPAPTGQGMLPLPPEQKTDQTVMFVTALLSAGTDGMTSKQISDSVLKLKSPKGLGPVMGRIKADILKKTNISFDKFFEMAKTEHGKVWKIAADRGGELAKAFSISVKGKE